MARKSATQNKNLLQTQIKFAVIIKTILKIYIKLPQIQKFSVNTGTSNIPKGFLCLIQEFQYETQDFGIAELTLPAGPP